MEEIEPLREALASAKQLLASQAARLRQQDLVLSGIRAISVDDEPVAAMGQAFEVLRTAIAFDQALVLEPAAEGFVCTASTREACVGQTWPSGSFFRRVAEGRPAVAPDVSRVPEWSAGACVSLPVGALFTPVATAAGAGLLILCADRHGAYGATDLALVTRLALLVSQTLSAGQQRRLAEAVRRSELEREAAVRANEVKTRFFANMSHEIRTPLNGVVATAELLAAGELSPRQREMAELILDSGRMLEGLLHDVLDFAKIEAGRLDLEHAAFNLVADLRSVFDLFSVKAAAKGLTLRIAVDAGAEGWFEGDSLRVRQVVSNLLSNAVKFTETGEVSVEVTADGAAEIGGVERLKVRVRDSGCGFDAETAERLFERFEQEDGSTTRRFGGSGLGLAIARTLARMMGGDICAESVRGEGALFEFWFQARRAEPAHAHAAVIAEAPLDAGLRILVAEDNPNNRRIVAMILESVGMSATYAEDGEAALRACEAQRFDLILMDLQMPVMDGLESTRAIRAFERRAGLARTPIVAVSANAMVHQVEEALAAGADAHVSKPISPAALLQVIAAVSAPDPAPEQAVA